MFEVESLDFEQMDAEQAAWADLASRALEPNAFFEPAFALSAARHFPVRARPHFVAVWQPAPAGARRLVGLFPISPTAAPGSGMTQLWLHKQSTLATPLLDRHQAIAVFAAFFDWLEAHDGAPGVIIPHLPKDGAVHAALEAAALLSGRRFDIIDSHERAALYGGGDAAALFERGASLKALRELRRRHRRLAELGPLKVTRTATPAETRRAIEEFLRLEASGWKGAHGAFLCHASLTTFVRSAARLMAREGKCSVVSLRLAGAPIAMGIVLESYGRCYFWKIAFDEAYRSYAPGVHLTYELTSLLAARGDVALTDSCAIPDHPMINKLWPDRIAICDVALELRPERVADFTASCRRERARRNLRAFAKKAVVGLLKRKAV
jgi:CelD/BcsL family acetyltransferase involved in cellulose biosynthesis